MVNGLGDAGQPQSSRQSHIYNMKFQFWAVGAAEKKLSAIIMLLLRAVFFNVSMNFLGGLK